MLNRISASIRFRAKENRRRIARKWRAFKVSTRRKPESKYVRFVNELQACVPGGLEGKRLLEIGSDPSGEFLRECVQWGKVSVATGINPVITQPVESPRIRLENIDARKMPFPDASFDVIASISVFEHVFDLAQVLEECYRVLVPGGTLMTEFGPIWSSCWGHHLWLYYGGEVVEWRTHPLPPYAHLLMEPRQLQAWCNERFQDPDLSVKIAQYVFGSDEQNRLFFSDYAEAVEASCFETVFFVGIPDVPHPAGTPLADYVANFSELKKRFPGKTGFGYHVIRFMLRKPA
jgi:SAM-dependent methyltransferase